LCRRHRLQLLQHVVHLRQREFRVLGLTAFPERIEFLGSISKFILESVIHFRERKWIETFDFKISGVVSNAKPST
jgi:hypothetical protein